MTQIQLTKKIKIIGEIEILTGMHIGGSSSSLGIGEIDANVIKKASGEPYIPGSSLKGKLRYLLEIKTYPLKKRGDTLTLEEEDKLKKDTNNKNKLLKQFDKEHPEGYFGNSVHEFFDKEHIDNIIRIFGASAESSAEPNRLIVRDSDLILESILDIENKEHNEKFKELELTYTESKWENTINRINSSANPRDLERVPAGAKFKFEFIFNVFNEGEDTKLLNELVSAMELLEDDYLGGSGTRGYGKIKFGDITIIEKTMKNYNEGTDGVEVVRKISDLKTLRQEEEFKKLTQNANQETSN